MNAKLEEVLPPVPSEGQGMSDLLNPHTADLVNTVEVQPLTSLEPVSESLRGAITAERRKRAVEGAENLSTIVAQREALERGKIDGVTGLRNAKAFKDEYPSIFKRMGVGQVTMVFGDLNGLKRVNEISHGKGNKYLETVAQALSNALRPTDLVYRLGGDEIGAILDGPIDEETLALINERLTIVVNEAIAELNLPEGTYPGFSIGSAVKREDDTPESLLERADQASIAAKEEFYADIEAETGQNLRR